MPTSFPSNYQAITAERSRLVGQVKVSGAKNSALRLLVASLLTPEAVHLDNYPEAILDAAVQVEMLELLGKKCEVTHDRIQITEVTPPPSQLDYHGRSIRNTLLVLGALTARTGAGRVPLPGGCQLGDRKYDLHEHVLRSLGAKVWEEQGMLCAEAPHGLHGAEIHLQLRSTGATENAILCGALAQGTTKIWNPHVRPEILDLIDFLRKMGATIHLRGQESIEIHGAEFLKGTHHRVVPDNIEALTWLIAATITGGDIEIDGFPRRHLEVPLIHLRESGARFFQSEDKMIARGGDCYPIEVSTGPYPGINSDMQPLLAVYGSQALGETRIIDLRFPGRYRYAEELGKMGLKFEVDGNLLKIQGGHSLHGAEVTALDLRAGIALLLAAFTAEGSSTIADAWQIARGYNKLPEKLAALGATFAITP